MTTQKHKSATPAKLADGTWGAMSFARLSAGEVICVTAKSGKSWTATVAAIVDDSRSGRTIVSLVGRDTAPAVHPQALTSAGNCGFGPDAMAYDDI